MTRLCWDPCLQCAGRERKKVSEGPPEQSRFVYFTVGVCQRFPRVRARRTSREGSLKEGAGNACGGVTNALG